MKGDRDRRRQIQNMIMRSLAHRMKPCYAFGGVNVGVGKSTASLGAGLWLAGSGPAGSGKAELKGWRDWSVVGGSGVPRWEVMRAACKRWRRGLLCGCILAMSRLANS